MRKLGRENWQVGNKKIALTISKGQLMVKVGGGFVDLREWAENHQRALRGWETEYLSNSHRKVIEELNGVSNRQQLPPPPPQPPPQKSLQSEVLMPKSKPVVPAFRMARADKIIRGLSVA